VSSSRVCRDRAHHFTLDRILDAYEAFANAGKTKALKVIIEA